MSGLVQTTAPAGEPVTLAEAKAWLRFDGSDEDVLITSLIEAARAYVETFTRRALITQQFELSLDQWPGDGRVVAGRVSETRGSFPCGRMIVLPRPPLVSVQSVKYYDTDGVLQTFASAGYHSDIRAQPGRIVLADGYDWPDVAIRPNAVVVAYTAGFGTSSQVPQGIRTAMRMLLTHWFTNRSAINIGNIVNQIPDSADALLWQSRIPEAY